MARKLLRIRATDRDADHPCWLLACLVCETPLAFSACGCEDRPREVNPLDGYCDACYETLVPFFRSLLPIRDHGVGA